MTMHTPGPWRVSSRDAYSEAHHVETETNPSQGLATITMLPNALANAQLMAAAPDLLAALEDAQEVMHWMFCGPSAPPSWNGACAKECIQAQAAIAKSKGEASGGATYEPA